MGAGLNGLDGLGGITVINRNHHWPTPDFIHPESICEQGPVIIHPQNIKENNVHAIQMTAGPDLDRLSRDTAGAGAGAFGAQRIGTIRWKESGLKNEEELCAEKKASALNRGKEAGIATLSRLGVQDQANNQATRRVSLGT